ncbi:MAG: 4Fe-4S binding protein [Bacteroides sp.]|nr:4Fe-4S binding protein [Bacteroides sp.]
MRNLKVIRIFLATLFFVATVAYLFLGPQVHPMAVSARSVQIIPSAIAVSLGAIIVWLPATFLFGRVYCSTVCPVGTLQDFMLPLRRRLMRHPRFRWRNAKSLRYHIAVIYLLALLAGVMVVPFVIEPWNIMRNIASVVRLSAIQESWLTLGIGGLTGICAGIVSLVALLFAGVLFGREFCNTVCPIGTGLGILSNASLYRIEIDPDKCVSCLECEDICRASCVKVVSRYVDNSRCVRCFDCLKVCKHDAIRFQQGRNRTATPLMRKKMKA